jgi:hypothetical protein
MLRRGEAFHDDNDRADNQFYTDMTDMRYDTRIRLAGRGRFTQAYIDALAAFRPERTSMIGPVRQLRLEAYASLIQIASERAIQCWDLMRYKNAEQASLAHDSQGGATAWRRISRRTMGPRFASDGPAGGPCGHHQAAQCNT